MSPRFLSITQLIGSLLGVMFLSANAIKAEAGQLKAAPDNKICSKNSLLQSAFFKQVETLCLKTEKSISESNDSEQNSDNSGDKGNSDKSKEESEPATSDSGFKINVFFNFGGSNGEQLDIGNGFTSPAPMQSAPILAIPSQKAPKKIKGVKPQKLVTPKSPTLNRLSPRKGFKPISPKYPQSIKNLIVPTKSVRPIILNRPAPALRIRSVQPMIKQNPMINRGMSRPVQRRSK